MTRVVATHHVCHVAIGYYLKQSSSLVVLVVWFEFD